MVDKKIQIRMLLESRHRCEKSHIVIVQNNTSDLSFWVTLWVCISCHLRVQGGCDHRLIWNTLFPVSDPKVSEVGLICGGRTQRWQQRCDLWELVCTLVLAPGFAFWKEVVNNKICVYKQHVLQCWQCCQSCRNDSLGCYILTKPLWVRQEVIIIFCLANSNFTMHAGRKSGKSRQGNLNLDHLNSHLLIWKYIKPLMFSFFKIS